MSAHGAEPATVLLLGEPRLRRMSRAVRDTGTPAYREAADCLLETLQAFRRRHGVGRAIAAPQIGIDLRLIGCALPGGELGPNAPFVLANPEITWRSAETFTLWDDCMSFPDLLVKVRRHRSISVRFELAGEREVTVERLDPATSELLQHEIDHLDGVLAIDRAVDRDALLSRAVFESNRAGFAALVDYVIAPPGGPA